MVPALRLGLVLLAAVLVVPGCQRGSPVDEALRRGHTALDEGKMEEAEKAFLEVLDARPDDPMALGQLGRLCYDDGRYLQAYAFLEPAIKSQPTNPDFQLAWGQVSFAFGRAAEAHAAARAVLAVREDDQAALLLLADSALDSATQTQAVKLLDDLQSKHPRLAAVKVARAVIERAQKELPGAETLLRQAIELQPESSSAHHQLSLVLADLGKTAESEAAFAEAVRLAAPRGPVRMLAIQRALRRGDRAEAATLLSGVLAASPDFLPAQLLEMRLAFEDRRFDRAGEVAQRILTRDQTNLDAMIQLAKVALAEARPDDAISTLKRAETLYDQVAAVKLHLASAHLAKGDTYSAEEQLKRALQVAPGHLEATVQLAEIQLQRGDAAGVVLILQPLAEKNPGLRPLNLLLAQAYRQRGDTEQAIKALRAVAAAGPEVPENHLLLGLALRRLDPAGARTALLAATRLAADYWPAHEALTDLDLRETRLADAALRANDLVARYPEAAAAWLLRAKTRLAQADLAGAESDLEKALLLDPTQPQAYGHLARVRFGRGDAQEAVAALAAAAERAPHPTGLTQLGMLHESLGDLTAARRAYERAIELNPQFLPAINNLASLLVELGPAEVDRAVSLAKQAKELDPNNPLVNDTLGWALVQQGQLAAGVPLLQSSAERLPEEPAVHYHLGSALYYLGQEEPARAALSQALRLELRGERRQLAERRLAVLDANQPFSAAQLQTLQQSASADRLDTVTRIKLAAHAASERQVDDAIAAYQEVLAVHPGSALAAIGLAELLLDAGGSQERVKDLVKQARAVRTADANVAGRLGRLLLAIGDVAGAVAVLQDAVRLESDSAELWFDLARASYAAVREGDAVRAIEEARNRRPEAALAKQIESWTVLVAAAREGSPSAEVQRLAEHAIASDPRHLPALLVLARAAESRADASTAAQQYESILAFQPQFAPALRQLAVLSFDVLKDDAKAEKFATQARSALPDDAEVGYVVGGLAYNKREYAQALRTLNFAARRADAHAGIKFLVGMSHFQLKNHREARTTLERALELGLPAERSLEARRILELINQGGLGLSAY